MTFAEFLKQNLDCEECPVGKAGYCSPQNLGYSYDPPCSSANPDQDMNDWIKEEDEQIAK